MGDLQLSGVYFTIQEMLQGKILIDKSGKCCLSQEGFYQMQESKTNFSDIEGYVHCPHCIFKSVLGTY